MANYLLTHGIDPSVGAGTGLDALHWAANRGQLEAIEELPKAGARLEDVEYPTGHERIDEILRRHRSA